MNPAIVGAIVVQIIVSRVNRIAGAVVGFLITTGILIWGLNAYSDGMIITLFGIELSKSAFIIACVVWYLFDGVELFQAWNARGMQVPPPAEPPQA
jgi:hypothetical protein